MHGRIRLMGTPSTCMQFAQNADEFEIDGRPPAYRWIELDPRLATSRPASNGWTKMRDLRGIGLATAAVAALAPALPRGRARAVAR